MHIDALSLLCAQLTRDLLAIAKFLFVLYLHSTPPLGGHFGNITITITMTKLEWWVTKR